MTEQEEYEAAYEALYGKRPVIKKRGSWLAIGDGPDWMALKVRRSELQAMTSQLRFRLKQKEQSDG